jgi:hypothetical protein
MSYRAISLGVVPANAGTHNHRIMLSRKAAEQLA